MTHFLPALKRELQLVLREPAAVYNALMFYVLVAALFPLGIGPEPAVIGAIAPGLIWVIALLAVLLSVENLFREDFADGCLEQFLLSSHSLYFMLMAKLLVQSAALVIPLLLLAPVLIVFFGLDWGALPALLLTLLAGVPALLLIGAIGAALTVGFERSGLLLSLLILPLYVPVLIFASSALQSAVEGFNFLPALAMLTAFSLLALALAPMAVLAALRLQFHL